VPVASVANANANANAANANANANAANANATREARVFVKDGATWQITLSGRSHAVRQARGEAVETLQTSFSGGAVAWRDADRKIAAKIADGWVELDPE
jgi:hypothetical protein